MKTEHWTRLLELAMYSPIISTWLSARETHRIESDDDMLVGMIVALEGALQSSMDAHRNLLENRPASMVEPQ